MTVTDWHPEPLEMSVHHPREGASYLRVKAWPRQIEVQRRILSIADHCTVTGDLLTMTTANGAARYYRVGVDEARDVELYQLEFCWRREDG